MDICCVVICIGLHLNFYTSVGLQINLLDRKLKRLKLLFLKFMSNVLSENVGVNNHVITMFSLQITSYDVNQIFD